MVSVVSPVELYGNVSSFSAGGRVGRAQCGLSVWALVAGACFGAFFQATVNLLNTWGDEKSGVDAVPGAIRTTPQVHDGIVSMLMLLGVALGCALMAAGLGLSLCWYKDGNGGVGFCIPLLLAGLVGFLGATNYSTGFKFKYRGLGVPFVSILMGPIEVYVALLLLLPMFDLFAHLRAQVAFLVVTLPVAALVGVVMHGNDMRDMVTDRSAGIMTLALKLGPRGSLVYYWLCHLLPHVVCLALAVGCRSPWFSLPLLELPLSIRTLTVATRVYKRNPSCPLWMRLERSSGLALLVFGTLYSISFACGT